MYFQYTYSFDDLALVPREKSTIESREHVGTKTNFLGMSCKLPVVVAPMTKVVGPEMAEAINAVGGICFLPRTEDGSKDLELYKQLSKTISTFSIIPSVPANNCMFRVRDFYNAGAVSVCIDVANGLSVSVERAIKEIRQEFPILKIITGNIGSLEGYVFLADLGVDAVRVGIGAGSACSTSLKTAVGTGLASLLRDVASFREAASSTSDKLPLIIADGGIKSSRELCLSIALGADMVMMGKYFACCRESPGQVIKFNGQLYKHYAGQASHAVKKSNRYIEGDDTLIRLRGTVEEAWLQLRDGLQSSMSYMNCKDIEEFKFLPSNCFNIQSPGGQKDRTIHAI